MLNTTVIFTLIKGVEIVTKEKSITTIDRTSRDDTIVHMCNLGFWDDDGVFYSGHFIYSAKIK
jgi:hypothetical protein